MTAEWLSVYYNKNRETDLYIRETYFVVDKQDNYFTYAEDNLMDPNGKKVRRSKCWTQSAYHRVFGLYVRRRLDLKKPYQQQMDDFQLSAVSFPDKTILTDWHQYLMYWPVVNYPARMQTHFLDQQNHPVSRNEPSVRERWFYQSITSMLAMGRIRGNPDAEQTFQAEDKSDCNNLLGKRFLIQQYFRRSARKQLGKHVFIAFKGQLTLIDICFDGNFNTAAAVGDGGDGGGGGKGRGRGRGRGGVLHSNYNFHVFSNSSISAMYPTIRNEWCELVGGQWIETKPQVLTRQVFAMGLAYRRFGQNGKSVICMARDVDIQTGLVGPLVLPNQIEWNYNYEYFNPLRQNQKRSATVQ